MPNDFCKILVFYYPSSQFKTDLQSITNAMPHNEIQLLFLKRAPSCRNYLQLFSVLSCLNTLTLEATESFLPVIQKQLMCTYLCLAVGIQQLIFLKKQPLSSWEFRIWWQEKE